MWLRRHCIGRPRPRIAEATGPEVEELAPILARAEIPGRVTRINTTMEEGLLAATGAAAKRPGQSWSACRAEAVRGTLSCERAA